ncbi:MAG: NAD-dependent protein deacylase [Candidatus Omnitrophica bacterium]|nr:NAD-dependent protein deacylase [Candidatus Omnitrophota bacterium]
MRDKIREVVKILKNSQRILFVTGAGISADSGLPTYRGIGGLYNDNFTSAGVPIETVLAGQTLRVRPELTWKYLLQLEERCRNAKFNTAHKIIAQMDDYFDYVRVFTQNIDGFHKAAGSKNVTDIHGDMHILYCESCSWRKYFDDYSKLSLLPLCPECEKPIRPEVVFFGEMLPVSKIDSFTGEVDTFDVYFSIGTTGVFPYIKYPFLVAHQLNRPVVEINPSDTELSALADIKISEGATDALAKIWELYKKEAGFNRKEG